jgi:hypothetical protein
LEKLRKTLILWNVAPLTVVAILCGLTIWMVDSLLSMESCSDGLDAKYVALSGLITVMSGLLFKMYDKMQKDNKVKEDDLEE